MTDNISDLARAVITLAEREARRFRHEYIGTEHILLALVDDARGTISDVLASLGIDAEKVRHETDNIVRPGPPGKLPAHLPLTPRARQAIEFAREETQYWSQQQVGPEHLLLGLVRERDGVAGQVLRSLGINSNELVHELLRNRIEQMKIVERAVRPVRAGIQRKRKMREELLTHLSVIFDQEYDKLRDSSRALTNASQRFGDPAELALELEAALPYYERFTFWFEQLFAWRAPESAARYSFRMAVSTLCILIAVFFATESAILLRWGWVDAVPTIGRVLLAILLFAPLIQFVATLLKIRIRDCLFGVFGCRRSPMAAVALSFVLSATISAGFFGFIMGATRNMHMAIELLPLCGVVGILFAVTSLIAVRFGGPTTIHATIWAYLDVGRRVTDVVGGQDDRSAVAPA